MRNGLDGSLILRSNRSIRLSIVTIAAVILIPLLFVGGWLASQFANSERALLEQNAEHEARGITALIDREITNTKGVLAALANSPYLQTGEVEAFYRQALAVSRQLGIQIVLRDPNLDEQLINTEFPWGTPLRGIRPERREADNKLLASGEVFVTGVFLGPLIKQYVIAVILPVMKNGTAVYFLSIGIPTEKFAAIINNTQLPPQWVVTIVDRQNVVVARSERHDETVGTILRNEFASIASEYGGVTKGIDRHGIAVTWTYRRSEAAGWFISVGVPESVLSAPYRTTMTRYGAAASLIFVVAMALSFHFGGRISQSVGALGIDRKPTRQEFEVLFESAPNGVILVDSDGQIVLLNARLEAKFGYSRDELVGQPVEKLIPERLRRGHFKLRSAFVLAPQSRPMGAGRDLYGRRKDGSEFPIEISLNPIQTRSGNLIMATVVDITERKEAAERLTIAVGERDDLRRRFLQAQEDERLRLAHELHDQTGQSLAAAMLEIKQIEKFVDENGRERLRQLRHQLEQMGKVLHQIALELRPASIDELGLESVLGTYISGWGAQFNIEADFHCRNIILDELPPEIRTIIYRIVQEALTNITKHARTTSAVSIVIDRTDKTLQLTIEDNGYGFDPTLPPEPNGQQKSGGLGIAGMRERLALIDGDLVIESSIGGGTTIFARIPLEFERMIA